MWDVKHVDILVEMLAERKMEVSEHPDLILWFPWYVVDFKVALGCYEIDIDPYSGVQITTRSLERVP